MRIRIDINITNKAFEGNWRAEVLSIVTAALPKMHDDVEVVNLRDSKGQPVGKITRLDK